MVSISPKQFYDETDNLFELKTTLKKDRYVKPFLFLSHYFFNEHSKWITATTLQERLCIPNHSNAYQILETFRILNLLTKKIQHNKTFFFPINETYWNYTKKEIK